MHIRLFILATVLMLSTGPFGPFCNAQQDSPVQTVRGDLLTIKGELYIVKDISGLLRYLKVNKETKRERLIVPGERIEAQVTPDGLAISIKPTS